MISPLSQLLGLALRASGLEPADQLWRVHAVWPTAVGASLGARAQPLRLTKGELLVGVPDAVWRQELSLLAPQVVARLNEQLGSPVVQRLRLVGWSGEARAEPPPRPRRLHGPADSTGAGTDALPALPQGIDTAFRALWEARARRLERDRVPRRREEE